MAEISGAELLGIRSHAAMADDYTTICRNNTDRLTQAYLALQVENVRLREENIRMRHRIECLRGALKSAAGKFFEIGERGAGKDCIEWAGDMEPPLMGSNA